MEEKANIIINKFTNALSQINPIVFMNQIKNVKESSQFLEISKKFCEIITNTKAQILFDISEEIHSLVNQKDSSIINNTIDKTLNLNINNEITKDVKSILSQFKLKISAISSNISELNSSLNIISGNLKKQKYSLASSRIEKLYKLKDNMNLNINSLEKLYTKISESLKSKKNILDTKSKSLNTTIKRKPTRTPPPLRTFNNNSRIQEKKEIIKRNKNLSSNKSTNYIIKKDSLRSIESKNKILINISNTSNKSNKSNTKSSTPIKVHIKKNETKHEINYKENNDKNIINSQKEIIEKLKSEIEILKENNMIKSIEDNNSIKIKLENNVLLFLNKKLRAI